MESSAGTVAEPITRSIRPTVGLSPIGYVQGFLAHKSEEVGRSSVGKRARNDSAVSVGPMLSDLSREMRPLAEAVRKAAPPLGKPYLVWRSSGHPVSGPAHEGKLFYLTRSRAHRVL